MKVLVVGGGGREHALCWKLSQSRSVHKIYCAPGNAGTSLVAENVPIDSMDIDKLLAFAEHQAVDLTVVGPEKPLIAGIVDAFEARGLRIFGPSREPAMLESSKAFAKQIMRRGNIPTADFHVFDNADAAREFLKQSAYPIVVKADGEAAGKGVVVAPDYQTADAAIQKIMERRIFGDSGDRVVIEECLVGEEISVLAFVDGDSVAPLLAVQDHKRALDNDEGPNTGGMGAYAPVAFARQSVIDQVTATVLRPAVKAIRETGIPYRGILFAGIMLTSDGPKCLEFNCRFGDPETQVLLPLLENDLGDVLNAVVDAELDKINLTFSHRSAVNVVLASGGYPGDYEKGKTIYGLDDAARMDAVAVFHAGTRFDTNGNTITDGGRVLSITATGDNFDEARTRCYAAVDCLSFDKMFYRKDIGARGGKK